MPGPAPNPNARRRNARPGVTSLPSGGRAGDAPVWPLPGLTDAEGVVWVSLWGTPQAVAWERLGWTRAVARYCRLLVVAEATGDPRLALAAAGEVRQLEDRLGLTPMSMRRLMWEIVADEVAEQRDDHVEAARPKRRRLTAVADAVAGA